MGRLIAALPTVYFFAARALGAGETFVALSVAGVAATVLMFWRRDDVIFLGCNLHFLCAGPVIWLCYQLGFVRLALGMLDWVLVGVPGFIAAVLIWRALRDRQVSDLGLAVLGCAAVLFSALHHEDYRLAVALPIMVLSGAMILRRKVWGI